MADQILPEPPAPADPMFPTLTLAQQTRLAAHGRVRQVETGETLVDADDHRMKFFVVRQGLLQILKASRDKEEVVAMVRPGAFTGELNMLSGRRGLVRILAVEPGEV